MLKEVYHVDQSWIDTDQSVKAIYKLLKLTISLLEKLINQSVLNKELLKEVAHINVNYIDVINAKNIKPDHILADQIVLI